MPVVARVSALAKARATRVARATTPVEARVAVVVPPVSSVVIYLHCQAAKE
jgi:hypothetical protein